MQVQHQSPGILVFQSALFQTTTTVIDTPDLVLVIDPNWLPEEIANIRNHVAKVRQGKPLYLLFTHSDYDHIIGYNAFPGATCIASRAFVQNPEKAAVLQQIRDFDDEYYIRRDYAIAYPLIDIEIEKDGQVLQVGDTEITFWLAPGHNPDGLFAFVKTGNFFIVGDYLSDVEFPYIYYSSVEYEKTILKADEIIKTYQPKYLIPGHGHVTDSTVEMHQRIVDSGDYILDLRKHLQQGTTFPLDQLLARYHFPKIMTKFHEGNIALMQKELGN